MPIKPLSEYQKNAAIIKEVEARLAAANKAEWEKIRNERQDIAEKFKLKNLTYCYLKKPKGFAKIIPALAVRLTWKGYLNKTQTEITKEVQLKFPNIKIPLNIWQKKLNRWELDEVTTQINCNMQAPVKLKKCKTLSDIKTLLKAHANMDAASFSFNARISLDKKSLVAGDNTYPIVMKKSGKYKYPIIRVTTAQGKRTDLRLDALVRLFIK